MRRRLPMAAPVVTDLVNEVNGTTGVAVGEVSSETIRRVHLVVLQSMEPEERCVLCERPLSTHGAPVVIDGETFIPACEQIHPGGLVEEDLLTGDVELARWPIVRPPAVLLRRARLMSPERALRIAGSLGQTSKMPGASYGLDARRCITGAQLVDKPGSVCEGCYALKNFYAYWRPAIIARDRRHAGLDHPLWPEALVALLLEYLRRGGEHFFRWHDSGDLQSVPHLARIAGVAAALPGVSFWLPTREYQIVGDYLGGGGELPPNLTVRLSAHRVGQAPDISDERLLGLPVSTVHAPADGPVMVSDRRSDVVVCRASTRENQCGKCRACWNSRVRSVSYPMH
jgi:hypothetical protein